MGIFKKKKGSPGENNNEHLFNEAVKEINELYDDVKSDYADVETVISEFSELIEEIKGRLDTNEIKKLEDFTLRLQKVNNCAGNSIRDIRDVLRNHKKRLNEIKREKA